MLGECEHGRRVVGKDEGADRLPACPEGSTPEDVPDAGPARAREEQRAQQEAMSGREQGKRRKRVRRRSTRAELEVCRDRAGEPGPETTQAEDHRIRRGDEEGDQPRCTVERDEQRNECTPGDPGEPVNRERNDARDARQQGAGEPPCGTRRGAHRGRGVMRSARRWVGIALVPVLAIFAVCLGDTLAWIGKPFPGFLIAENGIVVSLGRQQWTDSRNRSVPFARVLAVDGHAVSGGRDVQAYVKAVAAGQEITYTLRNGTEIFGIQQKVRLFDTRDFLLLFVPLLGVGLLMI